GLAGQVSMQPALLRGIGLAVAALLAHEIPGTVTRIGLQMALAQDRETRARGVRLLKLAGSEELLLRLCYVRSGMATDMVGFLFHLTGRVEPEEVRKVYYRVTGTAFNAGPTPAAVRLGRGPLFFDGGGDWDFDQGGDSAGGQVRGLSLAASRLDGSVDANAALGLPHFHERNFGIPSGLQHAVWIQSGQSTTRRDIEDASLTGSGQPLLLERAPAEAAWTLDSKSAGHLVLQRLEQRPAVIPRRLAVVVDGSAAMRDAIAPIARELKRIAHHVELELFIAADDVRTDSAAMLSGTAGVQRLLDLRYSGGH